jgi:predicted Fe-S protein YdhL (DUF1289 family)
MKTPVVDSVASPCNSVCRMDARTDLCEGCLRTIDEIVAWSTMNDDEKRGVWDALMLRQNSSTRSERARTSAGPLPSGPGTPAGGGCGTPQAGVP